jgi:hypothetical protein
MEITRKKFLKLGLMGGVGLALPLGALSVPAGQSGPNRGRHEGGRVHGPQHKTSHERLTGSGVTSESPKRGFRRWLVT